MAQAILLQEVETLGGPGDVIDVSPGYLRNYLVPRKIAQPAPPASIAEAQRRWEAAERAAREAAERAQETSALLSRTVLTIPQPAGEDGGRFGSVVAQDVVDAISQARVFKLGLSNVHLEQPIRTTCTHMVTVEVHDDLTSTVKTIVSAL